MDYEDAILGQVASIEANMEAKAYPRENFVSIENIRDIGALETGSFRSKDLGKGSHASALGSDEEYAFVLEFPRHR